MIDCDASVFTPGKARYTLGLLLIVAMCLHADQNLAAPNLPLSRTQRVLSTVVRDTFPVQGLGFRDHGNEP